MLTPADGTKHFLQTEGGEVVATVLNSGTRRVRHQGYAAYFDWVLVETDYPLPSGRLMFALRMDGWHLDGFQGVSNTMYANPAYVKRQGRGNTRHLVVQSVIWDNRT